MEAQAPSAGAARGPGPSDATANRGLAWGGSGYGDGEGHLLTAEARLFLICKTASPFWLVLWEQPRIFPPRLTSQNSMAEKSSEMISAHRFFYCQVNSNSGWNAIKKATVVVSQQLLPRRGLSWAPLRDRAFFLGSQSSLHTYSNPYDCLCDCITTTLQSLEKRRRASRIFCRVCVLQSFQEFSRTDELKVFSSVVVT